MALTPATAAFLSRPQLSEGAAMHIRGLIMSGQLPPGSLVKPAEVGRSLGISATPVREALQALRAEGFLELVPRHGFRVAPLTAQDIRDLFVAFALLGGETASRAAVRMTPEDLAELEALQHELQAAARHQDHTLLMEKNFAFHGKIGRVADARKIDWIQGLLSRYGTSEIYERIEGWPEASERDHASILAALASRDAEGARAAMYRHLVHAGELLAASFERRLDCVSSMSE